MQTLKALIILSALTCVFSCKNGGTSATTIEVTVTDGSSGGVAAGATVYVYESNAAAVANTPKYTGTTNQSGRAKLTVVYLSQYYIVAQKGSAKNYYNGLIPVGIFKSQSDIQNNPGQTPPSVIGGVRFGDTNHDGVINNQDNVAAPTINLVANTNNTFSTTIY